MKLVAHAPDELEAIAWSNKGWSIEPVPDDDMVHPYGEICTICSVLPPVPSTAHPAINRSDRSTIGCLWAVTRFMFGHFRHGNLRRIESDEMVGLWCEPCHDGIAVQK
jgi:hypothetical protein